MTETRLIDLDAIVLDERQLTNYAVDANIKGLVKDLANKGLRYPVLVDEDLNLIDGRARIIAWKALGHQTIHAIVSDNLEDSCEALREAHKTAPSFRRTYEIYHALRKQIDRRTQRLKRRDRSNETEKPPGARDLITEVLQLPMAGHITAISVTYQGFARIRAEKPGLADVVDEIQRDLESGARTLYEARGAVYRLEARGAQEEHSLHEQRAMIGTALTQLVGTVKGLNRIGPLSDDLSSAEAQMYADSFKALQRDLSRFLSTLKKKV